MSRAPCAVDGFGTSRLGTGTWKLNACPIDGGGLVISQGKIISAWRRDHEIFLATPGEGEARIAEGIDVSITAAPSGIYAIWSTPAGIQALLPGKKAPIAIAPKGSFPNIAATPDGRALAAWENDGKITIQMVP